MKLYITLSAIAIAVFLVTIGTKYFGPPARLLHSCDGSCCFSNYRLHALMELSVCCQDLHDPYLTRLSSSMRQISFGTGMPLSVRETSNSSWTLLWEQIFFLGRGFIQSSQSSYLNFSEELWALTAPKQAEKVKKY